VSYQVFARKYRPQNFDAVVGQEHITRTLRNAIEQKRLAHAYLFVGPRGVGKTSTARILAKALNCEKGPTVNPCGTCDICREIAQGNSLDVLEIDGASNNGVEQVRELRENVRFAPARGRYKIYIIDEVHMLTSAAFNALLKTLEEPPDHVKFVFATTEPQKVLPTILSRCQRFDLRRIPAPLIARHLGYIASEEGIHLDAEASAAIARGAEGGLRDAESMLDQLVAFCGDRITEDDVLKIFGFTAQETVFSLCDALLAGSCPAALTIVHEQAENGRDLSRLMADLIGHLRNVLVAKADPEGLKDDVIGVSVEALIEQSSRIEMERLLDLIEQFAIAEGRMKWAPNKKLHFEIAVIKAVQTLQQATLDDVIKTLTALRSGSELPKLAVKPRTAAPAPGPPVRRNVSSPAVPPPPPLQIAKPAPEAAPGFEVSPKLPETEIGEPPRIAEKLEPGRGERLTVPSQSETAAEPLRSSGEEIWRSLGREIRRQRPLISAWLDYGKLLEIGEQFVLVGFPEEQKLAMESLLRPNNCKLLETTLSKLLGRPVGLRCETRAGLTVDLPEEKEENQQPDKDPMEEFRKDDLIRTALELFQAEIAETKE
jgi:DNA polymerase-3 subunit gamma/tau